MLMITTVTAIVAAFVAIAAFAGWIRTQQQLKQQRAQNEQLMNSLREEIRRVNRGAMGMGKHLIDIEQQLQQYEPGKTPVEPVAETVPPVLRNMTAVASTDGDLIPNYNQVLELLDQGCSPSQITKACGMSKAEIELMALVRNSTAIST